MAEEFLSQLLECGLIYQSFVYFHNQIITVLTYFDLLKAKKNVC